MNSPAAPPQGAIWLSEDHWIVPIDILDRRDQSVDIDALLKPLEAMWRALETHCVAACCGIDAFDFEPDSVAGAATTVGGQTMHEHLGRLREQLLALESDVLSSRRLNHNCHRADLVTLLEHLQRCAQS